jgi:hypothetical protein
VSVHSRPEVLCPACWDELFGPECRFADMLQRGMTAGLDSEDMPRVIYTREIGELKNSAALGCSWCAYILSRPERFAWDPEAGRDGPAAIDIEIIAFSWGSELDNLHIRVNVVGYEFVDTDFSCYAHRGKSSTIYL